MPTTPKTPAAKPAKPSAPAISGRPVKKGDHVFLVDGSGYIFRAYHALPPLTRMALLKTGIVPDLGTVSLIVTAAGVIGALCWYWAVRGTPLRLLFERPAWAKLKPARAPVLQPAE